MADAKAPPALRINFLREKIRLREVLAHFGHSYRLHGNMQCPMHSEKNPSARLYDDQDSLWCWSCAPNQGIDIIEFVIIELGLEQDSPTRGVAVLKAVDYLEEQFAISYDGVPWLNRLSSTLAKRNIVVKQEPNRYWHARHNHLLQQMTTISDPRKWTIYDQFYLEMRDLINENEDVQAPRWLEVSQQLCSLK